MKTRIPRKKEKFTLRKPVVFAIVSVASVLLIDDGVCKEASIVLGSVARACESRNAEEIIEGSMLDERIAEEAAKAAVVGARPLKMNRYKVEIAKALVNRAIPG